MFSKVRDLMPRRLININAKDLDIEKYDNRAEVEVWTQIYEGSPSWLATEADESNEPLESLNLGSALASRLAMLTTIEMSANVSGSERAEYLDKQLQKVICNLRINVEYALAKGGMIMKPFPLKNKKGIGVEFVQAGDFIALDFDEEGNMTSVVFIENIYRNDKCYTRLEFHRLNDDNTYTIWHRAFVSNYYSYNFGNEILLNEIEEWKGLPQYPFEYSEYPNTDKPLFSYFKPPMANNKDTKSKLGTSIFSNIEHLLKDADVMNQNIKYEYEAKQVAIDASVDFFTKGRFQIPKWRERVFRKLNVKGGQNVESFYKVYSPEIRDNSFYNGLENIKRSIELNSGVSYGTISKADEVEKTAEEIRSGKQLTHSTVVDIQKSLEHSLNEVIWIINRLTDADELAPKGEYESNFHFDDSIVVDQQTELAMMYNAVKDGLIEPQYYLMEKYGWSLEEAVERMPLQK